MLLFPKKSIAAIGALLLLGIQAPGAAANGGTPKNIYVDASVGSSGNCTTSSVTADDGNRACKTISDALGKANDGDTINVAAGTYTETVSITKPLSLVGPSTGDPAIVSGSVSVNGAKTGESVSISRMQITGGGNGISVAKEFAGTLNVDDSTIKNNSGFGFAYSGPPEGNAPTFNFTNSSFENNHTGEAANSHALSFFQFSGNASFDNVTITASSDTNKKGYGIQFFGPSTGSGQSVAPTGDAGTISLRNVTMSGPFFNGALYFNLYKSMKNVTMSNVDLIGTPIQPAGASSSRSQIALQTTGKGADGLNLGNTKLSSAVIWGPGDMDVTNAQFLKATDAGQLVKPDVVLDPIVIQDALQISLQVGDVLDLPLDANGEFEGIPMADLKNYFGMARIAPNSIFTNSRVGALTKTPPSIAIAQSVATGSDTIYVEGGGQYITDKKTNDTTLTSFTNPTFETLTNPAAQGSTQTLTATNNGSLPFTFTTSLPCSVSGTTLTANAATGSCAISVTSNAFAEGKVSEKQPVVGTTTSISLTSAPQPTPAPPAPTPTPTPTPVPPTPAPVAPIVIENPQAVTPAQVVALSPAQVATVAPAVVAALPPAAIAALSPAQAVALQPAQVAAIQPAQAAVLQPVVVQALAPAQLTAMTPQAVGGLNPIAICAPQGERCVPGQNGLTANQLAAFTPAAFAELTPVQATVLRPAQITELSGAQVRQLSPSAVRALAPETVGALSPEQTNTLRPARTRALLPEAVAAFSPEQAAALRPAAVRSIRPAAIAEMEPATLAALTPRQLNRMTSKQVNALTPAQVRALSPRQQRILGL